MKKILTATALLPLALSAAPAFAQDENFEGVSATLVGGIDNTRIAGSKAGMLYAGQIGYDLRSGNMMFGAEAEIGDATTKLCGAPDQICASAGRDLYAGVRVGVVAGSNTMIYAKGGYTNARTTFTDGNPLPPVAPASVTAEGWRVGAGVEQRIGGQIHLKAEYRFSEYGGGFSRHQGVVGIGFRF